MKGQFIGDILRKPPKGLFDLSIEKRKKKRVNLTPKQRMYIWEHPKAYGRKCSICHQKITKLSDLELDHTKAYSKGGTKLALAHRDCNRMKGSGSLRKVQKTLGIKKTRRSVKRKRKRTRKYNSFDIGLKIPKRLF